LLHANRLGLIWSSGKFARLFSFFLGFERLIKQSLNELRPIIGNNVDLEVVHFDPGPSETDMGLFSTLAGILRESDPDGVPVPLLLSGVTDGRFFSKLGIQIYGFLPMILSKDFNFSATIHAENERVPAAAIEFGANAIYKALERFG
jgi:acetylornithine deacetylase/succinyl-diaminopimelate desuccinylase-like protein